MGSYEWAEIFDLVGMTSNTFKERFRNHIKSFTHKKYSNETELSKYVWHLKENSTFERPHAHFYSLRIKTAHMS